MYRDELVQKFNDDMWVLYHDGTIDNKDNFYNEMYQWIDTKAIYTYESKKICGKLDYDIFQDHEVFGKARNWSQAIYAAIYDLLNEHEDTITYNKMKEQEANA